MDAPLPVFRLASLFVRQLSVPVTARIKRYVKSYPKFTRAVCHPVANVYKNCELRVRLLNSRLSGNYTYTPKPFAAKLTDTDAVNLAAEVFGELIVVTTWILIVSYYVYFSMNVRSAKFDNLEQKFIELTDKLEKATTDLEEQKHIISDLNCAVKVLQTIHEITDEKRIRIEAERKLAQREAEEKERIEREKREKEEAENPKPLTEVPQEAVQDGNQPKSEIDFKLVTTSLTSKPGGQILTKSDQLSEISSHPFKLYPWFWDSINKPKGRKSVDEKPQDKRPQAKEEQNEDIKKQQNHDSTESCRGNVCLKKNRVKFLFSKTDHDEKNNKKNNIESSTEKKKPAEPS